MSLVLGAVQYNAVMHLALLEYEKQLPIGLRADALPNSFQLLKGRLSAQWVIFACGIMEIGPGAG